MGMEWFPIQRLAASKIAGLILSQNRARFKADIGRPGVVVVLWADLQGG
jgi:hypothetical protein